MLCLDQHHVEGVPAGVAVRLGLDAVGLPVPLHDLRPLRGHDLPSDDRKRSGEHADQVGVPPLARHHAAASLASSTTSGSSCGRLRPVRMGMMTEVKPVESWMRTGAISVLKCSSATVVPTRAVTAALT